MEKTVVKIGMKPSHPGAFIKIEVLDELGLTVSRAAVALGVRRATLSDFINEKSALSPEMALRLEKAFGINMDMMLRMQALFDTYSMRKRAAEFKVLKWAAE